MKYCAGYEGSIARAYCKYYLVDGKELYQGRAVYGAPKAAPIALSSAMCLELSPEFNIGVSSIEPRTVDINLRDDFTYKELLEDRDYGGDETKLQPENTADSVLYFLNQPATVNVNELLIKLTERAYFLIYSYSNF